VGAGCTAEGCGEVVGHLEVLEEGSAVAAFFGRQGGKEGNGIARLKDGTQLIDGGRLGQIDFGNSDGAVGPALGIEKLHEAAGEKAVSPEYDDAGSRH
jgi:hypothetical protein